MMDQKPIRSVVVEPDEIALCISALHWRARAMRAEADFVERNFGNLGEAQAKRLRAAAARYEKCFGTFSALHDPMQRALS